MVVLFLMGRPFLVFSDYCRNALRVAALMRLRTLFVFTHDSIGLGEDGPTHQPVEHATSLRVIPNLDVWRPCDAVETLAAWGSMLGRTDGPSCLLATRQGVPHQEKTAKQIDDISRGAYILSELDKPQAMILGHRVRGGFGSRCAKITANRGHKYPSGVHAIN
jgi:transketolase